MCKGLTDCCKGSERLSGPIAFQQGAQVAAQFAQTAVTPLGHFAANVAGRGVGTALGILGAAWTIYSAVKGAEEERKREAEQQKAKNNIISGFNDLAEDIGREFSNNVRAFMAQNVDPIVAAFDEKIKSKNFPRSSGRQKILSARFKPANEIGVRIWDLGFRI